MTVALKQAPSPVIVSERTSPRPSGSPRGGMPISEFLEKLVERDPSKKEIIINAMIKFVCPGKTCAPSKHDFYRRDLLKIIYENDNGGLIPVGLQNFLRNVVCQAACSH